MEQAEYEEIRHNPETLQTITMDAPKEPGESKITQDELTLFITHYVSTTDDFKENFEKYIAREWGVKDFKDILEKNVPLVMSWIAKNIEMQSMPKGN